MVRQALEALIAAGDLPADFSASVQVTPSKEAEQGDFASNVALANAKRVGMAPRQLADKLVARMSADWLDHIEIAGPGFINFFLRADVNQSIVHQILHQGDAFGRSETGAGQRIQIEFVSANPTGPLHVGHGRGAAYGATLANLLRAIGHEVHCEYYVNDAGRQMDILATSVWLRYLDLAGETIDEFPSNGYQGDYIWDIAATLHREQGDVCRRSAEEVFKGVHADHPEGDKERHIDDLIDNAKTLLGADAYRKVFDLALETLVDVIRRDLALFGVEFDEWFSERELTEQGIVDQALRTLRDKQRIYESHGAQWFRSSDFGDEKDRVVRRDNGQTTYFASDIAYHMNKFDRDFDRVINIWGADHHGYIARVNAALQAMDYPADKLEILLVQFANLYENGEKMPMSTRSGEFVTLRTLREDVGRDAARFFYVMRKADQHMDFDLDLAREQSSDNPVYYVQYAHARVCSVEKQCAEQQVTFHVDRAKLDTLDNSHEQALLKQLALYPARLLSAAQRREPHILVNYLRDLANLFHSWYNAHKFIVDDEGLRNARLALAFATRQVLKNGLLLVGVSAPEQM